MLQGLTKSHSHQSEESKMVLPKQFVNICMSYDPNKKVMREKFFLRPWRFSK